MKIFCITISLAAALLTACNRPAVSRATPQHTAPAAAVAASASSTSPVRSTSLQGLTNDTMVFSFQAEPLDTVLTQMSQRYGLIIIQLQPLDFPITVRNPNPQDVKGGITLLNNLLFPLGYMANTSSTPDCHTVLRVLTIADAKKAQIPVYVGADPEKIPVSNDVITQIIPLQNIPANQLRIDLGPLISTDADVTSCGTSNALVVTDTSAKINRLVQIIQKLDNVKSVPLKVEYKQLQYTNAADAAILINNMFNPTNTNSAAVDDAGGGGGGGAAAGGTPGARGGAAGGRGGGSGVSGNGAALQGRLYASSDARTNTVVLNGPQDQVDQAVSMLNKIEAIPDDYLNTPGRARGGQITGLPQGSLGRGPGNSGTQPAGSPAR